MKYLTFEDRTVPHLISAPIIYSMIIPVVFFDVWIELYHRLAFPLYGIPLVERGNYIKIDRQKLSYLDGMQKLNCMYCGYVNGALHYWSTIAGETEKYWCGIKHKNESGFVEPRHHAAFTEFDDEVSYNRQYKEAPKTTEEQASRKQA